MQCDLRQFWNEHYSQLPGEFGQKLLLYIAFEQRFYQKFQLSFAADEPLEGNLPRLFRSIRRYEVKDAAFAFDALMPWNLLQGMPQLSNALDALRQELFESRCATPPWLQQQADALLDMETGSSVTVTPPGIRRLIAALAAQKPAQQIVDLCSGTFALGLEVWNAMGASPEVSCQGEELNAYLCAVSRLLLFLCDVTNFSVSERNIMDPLEETSPDIRRVFVADFPLVGNRTVPAPDNDPLFSGKRTNLYPDWVYIRSVLNRMRPGDRAFLIVTKGALVRRNERFLREDLVEQDCLDAIIRLPLGLYANHTLPMEILICEKGRAPGKKGQVFFADLFSFTASDNGRRSTQLSQDGIDLVAQAYQQFSPCAQTVQLIPVSDIRTFHYTLHPPIYLSHQQEHADGIVLGDVAAVIRGLQFPNGYLASTQGNRYLLNVRDIQNGEIHYETADRISAENPSWEQKFRIREDDIILTSKGTALKLAIVPPDPPPAYISGNLTILRTDSRQYSPYVLFEYLTSEEGINALNLIQTGTTIRVLGSGNLKQLPIPSYAIDSVTQIGQKIKSAALQYRKDILEINQAYWDTKNQLLIQLDQREE